MPEPGDVDLDMRRNIFEFDNIGELYEIGLAFNNQISKKQLGQYYTPKDTCQFMAQKIVDLFNKETDNLADVCCGTGNLIIEVLSILGKNESSKLIKSGKLYLYDLDKNAIRLAIMKIAILFVPKGDIATFNKIGELVNVGCGNFLSNKFHLPDSAVVISNPPYGKIPPDTKIWSQCKTASTNDMYAVFMDKIAAESKNAVIISPQSFLGGNKFAPLRAVLSKFGGCIYSFDNIPCPIFVGKKKGIFNTNTNNSVRAAITVVDKTRSGFRVSPMIRFKASERKEMFSQLDNLLGNITYAGTDPWTKIPKTLEPVITELKNAKEKVGDLIEKDVDKQERRFKITIPSTPRYFITGSCRDLDRSSKIEIFAKDQGSFERLYIMINSTFSYLWWRIYDGGITLSKQTLLSMPIPNLGAEEMKRIVEDGTSMEEGCIVNKMNAGKKNENIKFPDDYRKKVNHFILKALNASDTDDTLYSIHSNNLAAVLPFWVTG